MKSSYEINNFGDVFYSCVTAYKPKNIVELGVLHGYSTHHIFRGIQYNGFGHLNAYDLFEDYPYNHERQAVMEDFFKNDKNVSLHKRDAFEVYKEYSPSSVDMLHVDISNNGDIFNRIIEQWDDRMVQGGVILFEGGSEERDNVDWMSRYNKPKIRPAMETNETVLKKYVFGTYEKFPSLTVLLKKR